MSQAAPRRGRINRALVSATTEAVLDQVAEGEQWGAAWRDHQNAYFAAHGMALRVDVTAAIAGQHVGPIRMRAADSAAVAKAEEIARENALAARDPEKVLGVLTRNTATFTEADLDRHLTKH